MTDVSFIVNAIPVAQPRQRHRIVTSGGKSFTMNYTPKRDPVNVFKAACQDAASKALPAPITGPVSLWLTFIFPRPKGMTKKRSSNPRAWKVTKPDMDNVYKAFADSLKGIAWVDDSQVTWCNCQKIVASASEMPRVEVRIAELTGLVAS